MVKSIISFVCQECGYESPQWLGKCPECGNWNSFKEFHEQRAKGIGQRGGVSTNSTENVKPQTLSQIQYKETDRIQSGFLELDSVLGGGIVPGSVTLLAGDPGIGKSTLLLQLALNVAAESVIPSEAQAKSRNLTQQATKIIQSKNILSGTVEKDPSTAVGMTRGNKVLYVSGEESIEQIKLRASRIKNALQNLNLLLVSLTDTDAIAQIIATEKPTLAIVDSIQTVESEALDSLSGSIGQVRFAANTFIKTAKTLGVPIILVGHVTKEGMVAGPMVLSHMVDTVLFLEGEKFTQTRLLRSLKNRFGPVDEVGVFAMQSGGMIEVKNPEQLFLTERKENVPGSALVVIMEGTRPFLIEIQALVVYSRLPMPRRVASGIDHKRIELLLAVLQKQCRLSLDTYDVFVNVAGGLKVTDPAVDLGVCLALYSSLKNIPLAKTIGIAEVGLLGELRGVSGIEKRVREGKKLGFSNIITAKTDNSLRQVLEKFGLGTKESTEWKQEDGRHHKVNPNKSK